LFLLMKEMTTDKVVERIKDYGGVVLKTSSLIPGNKCFVTLLLAPLPPMRACPRGPPILTEEPERQDIKAALPP